MKALVVLLICLPSLALANCPPLADTSDDRAALHTALLRAVNEREASEIAAQLWQLWLTAPDAQAQALLDASIERRSAHDFAQSEAYLDELIAYCPDYTEAYNQRAFSRYLRDNFSGSLEDIDIVLATNPYHFGALSGQALNFMGQGRVELAQAALRRAVAIHPYLQERSFLRDDLEDDI